MRTGYYTTSRRASCHNFLSDFVLNPHSVTVDGEANVMAIINGSVICLVTLLPGECTQPFDRLYGQLAMVQASLVTTG